MTAAIAPTFPAPSRPAAELRALLSLLIVDDQRSVREAFREVVSSLGYRTGAVDSAE
jgi:hypothetical protein